MTRHESIPPREYDDFNSKGCGTLTSAKNCVAVVVGNGSIKTIREMGRKDGLKMGKISHDLTGRAFSILDDQEKNTGLYFLVDDKPRGDPNMIIRN